MIRALVTLAAAMVGLLSAASADTYPSRPITLVVPYGAGSGTDAIARMVAVHLTEALGQKVVVENKVGANGALGAASVARAEPDGYTILIGGVTTHAANPSLMKTISYDPVKDFAPIGQVGIFPYVLVVDAASPFRSLGDLIEAAKARPGQLSFAHGNALGHLSGEVLKRRAGIDLAKVPYRSSPQAITDLLGGRVTLLFTDMTASMSQIKAGALRALAVTNEERSGLMPELPTMREGGVPLSDIAAWTGIFAPARTPRPILEKLSAALTATMAKPELKEKLAVIGFEALPTPPEALGRRVAAEVAQWAVLTKEAGLEPQ
ncbi:Bug family tripartite tricarboxylate transporter substrate binding protein [Enterovirga rhinocerotis]|uniref:Tripartite-type tricarboxylate transporter receptor subunit TctC n=1 Tax=Enterovirga rhinocerotis TaxID=1339210 RepID=A0A4V3DYJ5_9HYPH|nr:tripartite tricarboxylate transporter substrate binding protein [Enterovirga rhinocerotis]TDR92889.1 tripartite-type tricarboxylate transporter receptor subunit TctC [Enterovirga rhinocerotis]